MRIIFIHVYVHTLQVKYVQARDAGVYECQVGTEPKMSHFVQLNVVGESPPPLRTIAGSDHLIFLIK